MNLETLKLYILPGNPPPAFPFRDLYNSAYAFYKETWERIFNRPKRPKLYDANSFFRQSYVLQIQDGSQIVGQTLATHFHLGNVITLDLPYFESLKESAVELLASRNAKSLLSMEYSALHRDFSPRKVNWLNLYEVLLHSGFTLAQCLDVDALVGHPRRLTKTHNIIDKLGYHCVQRQKQKYGVSVDVFVAFMSDLQPHSDPAISNLVRQLWATRTDTTGITNNGLGNHSRLYLKPQHAANLLESDLQMPTLV